MLCDRPGGLCRPRETLVPSRVQGVAYIPYGCRRDEATPVRAWLMAWAIQHLHSFRWRKGGVQIIRVVSHQSAFLAHRPWPNRYPKHQMHIEGLLFAQHVVARPRQLVRQRLDRHDAFVLRFLGRTFGER